MMTVNKSILKKVYRKRDSWSKKYDFGHLLVIGGSRQYSGSPTFNALAALRAGVDLVTIVAPERAANIIASFKPDLIAYPLECDYFSVERLEEVLQMADRKDAVVIGGGMTRRPEIMEFVIEFLKKIKLPIVIDADAIYALSKNTSALRGKQVIITPHSREFLVLSGKKVGNDLGERIKLVGAAAKEIGATILLKGHIDVISDGEKTVTNGTGSPFMTKGGCGDTLAGICGAYLARGLDAFTSACAAAFVNGRAGELAAKRYKESMMASDLIEEIPNAIK
jgi:NAD(P)H-hydrate epimerase